MTEFDRTQEPSVGEVGGYRSQARKLYGTPKITRYGDLRDLSKGTLAYSDEEGAYQEMNPPSN